MLAAGGQKMADSSRSGTRAVPRSRDEAYEALRGAFDRLRKTSFPDHPHDLDLAGWVLDLAEADAYVAGLADTVLAGGRPVGPVAGLEDLKSRLTELRAVGEDEEILAQCVRYFAALRDVHAALRDVMQ